MVSANEPTPENIGFSRLRQLLQRTHAEPWSLHLVSPSPVEGRAVIEVTEPGGTPRRYAFPAEDIDRVAELLASLHIDKRDLRRASR